jgi:hypothetical protein
MTDVTPADDRLHAAGDAHPLWSETAWFGFSHAERALGGTVYPLFRRNLGVCSLGVQVWDASAFEPWRLRYGRTQWHLPMPSGDLDDCQVGGATFTCEKPLSRYRIRYADGERISFDLVWEGLIEPHGFGIGDGRGHIDQPCHVTGTLQLDSESIEIDGFDMRDRSWNVRDDLRPTRASYSYAIASPSEMWLAGGFQLDPLSEESRIVAGFLVRDGVKANLLQGTHRVLERANGHPTRVAIEAEDALGRTLSATGLTTSRIANQATPGMFAWMSLAQWQIEGADGPPAHGADQDVWSPELLGR